MEAQHGRVAVASLVHAGPLARTGVTAEVARPGPLIPSVPRPDQQGERRHFIHLVYSGVNSVYTGGCIRKEVIENRFLRCGSRIALLPGILRRLTWKPEF